MIYIVQNNREICLTHDDFLVINTPYFLRSATLYYIVNKNI
jgi:hypothetical protein